jgi:choline kinase
VSSAAGLTRSDGAGPALSEQRPAVSPLPVLLAAGLGSRLGGRVKALFPLKDRALLDHCIETLSAAGFERVLIVTGHASDALEAHAAASRYPIFIEYVHNARYRNLNNFYTLRVACVAVRGPMLVLNSDIIFTPEVLDAVRDGEGDLRLAIEAGRVDAEALKVQVSGGVVHSLGKQLDARTAFGEFVGVSLMSERTRRQYIKAADEALARGQGTLYYEDVYDRLCDTVQARAVEVSPGSWAEIDRPSDITGAALVAERKAEGA